MPTFKTKQSTKSITSTQPTLTLDCMHKAFCVNLKKEQETLPSLKATADALKNKRALAATLAEKQLLGEKIATTEQTIKKLQKKEIDYMLNNASYLFAYYENKKNLTKQGTGSSAVLANFFQGTKDVKQEARNYEKEIVQKYITNQNASAFSLNAYATQPSCGMKGCAGEMIPLEHEGILVCNLCFASENYIVENEKSSYKDPPKEASFYAYKRINHFREILAQFQAKETTEIPEQVLTNIKQQIIKERISLEQLTNKRTKEILKKLGYNKYYEHIPFIKDKLGIKPPIMTVELESTLCSLFMDIQVPYAKCCPDDRVNFLNYYYTVYKLCELLDQTQFLPYFPMLKDRAKRIEQDEIWQKICTELDWAYIPTV